MSTEPSAIWILDCSNFMEYLEQAFHRMSARFPHLHGARKGFEWGWRTACLLRDDDRGGFTQRDDLINWIIREQLERIYLFEVRGHYKATEYIAVHNELVCNHDLDRQTTALLPIPRCRGEAQLVLLRRVAGALVIEYHGFPRL